VFLLQVEESISWIKKEKDPSWIEEKFINDEIGMFYVVEVNFKQHMANTGQFRSRNFWPSLAPLYILHFVRPAANSAPVAT